MTTVAQPQARHSRARIAARRVAVAATVALPLLFLLAYVLGQMLLPGIAADRIRDSLETHATGVRVSVTADPALELLLGHADAATVHIDQLYPGQNHRSVHDLFARIGETTDLDAYVREAFVSGLAIDDIHLTKRGSRLAGSATVTAAALDAALPLHLRVAEANPNASTLLLSARVDIFGHKLGGTASVKVERGQLVIAAANPLLAFLHATIFDDAHVRVETISAHAFDGGYTFVASGRFQ